MFTKPNAAKIILLSVNIFRLVTVAADHSDLAV
jgi:hypothetical protein